MKGFTISDDAAAVAGAERDLLGASDSVTVTGLANAAQGAPLMIVMQSPITSRLTLKILLPLLFKTKQSWIWPMTLALEVMATMI